MLAVFLAAQFFDLVEYRPEDIGLVIRDFRVCEIGEVSRALDDARDALEAHAGVDVLRRKRREGAVGVRVELNEDEVPNFDALGAALVDQRTSGVAGGSKIDVQFGAGTARARVAHHPEVVLLVAVDDVDFWIESRFVEKLRPAIMRLLVELARITRARLVDRGVETVRGKFPLFDNQFPSPCNSFLLEVIAERPIAEHLEERVVVGVKSDILEVVVLASGADAFLGVGGTPGDVRAPHLSEKNRHELVHASVGEQQVRRVGHQAR